MKKLGLMFALAFITYKASAQQFNSVDFVKQLGKTGTLCDTVKSFRIMSDTLALLNMGGEYPRQKYTVAVKGNKVSLNWTGLRGKIVCVTGVFELYKNEPQIVVAQPDKIDVK